MGQDQVNKSAHPDVHPDVKGIKAGALLSLQPNPALKALRCWPLHDGIRSALTMQEKPISVFLELITILSHADGIISNAALLILGIP